MMCLAREESVHAMCWSIAWLSWFYRNARTMQQNMNFKDYPRSPSQFGLLFVRILLLFALLLLIVGFLLLWDLHLFQRRIGINTQLLGHQTIDPLNQSGGVCDLVARLDQRGLEEHMRGILCCRVLLVGLDLAQEVCDHRVVRVDLQCLPARHHADL